MLSSLSRTLLLKSLAGPRPAQSSHARCAFSRAEPARPSTVGFVRYFATERRDRGSGRPRGSFRGGRGRGRGGRDDQRRSPRGGDRKEYGRMSRSSDDRPRRSASSERFSDRARPSRRRFVPRGGRGGRTGRDIGERSDRKSVSDRGRPDKARGGRVSGRGSSRGGRSAARDDDERPNRKPEFRKNRDEDTLGTINRPSTPIFNPPGAKPFASAASTATKPQKKAPKPAEIEGKPSTTSTMMPGGERLAKRIARCGVCSRRAAEELIRNGAVMVDGSIVTTPAINVYPGSQIIVNGQPIVAERPRLLVYNKPSGVIVQNLKPGEVDRPETQSLGAILAELELPAFKPVGRLDINTEGLLLLTNDGELKRHLELPDTELEREYRVRVFGQVDESQLVALEKGVEINGFTYRGCKATVEKKMGANTWLRMTLKEGKNREIKVILDSLGLKVSRLIRTRYGPYMLEKYDLPVGDIQEVSIAREHYRYIDRTWKWEDSDAPTTTVVAATAQAKKQQTHSITEDHEQ